MQDVNVQEKNAVSSLLPGTGGIGNTCQGDHSTLMRVKEIIIPFIK